MSALRIAARSVGVDAVVIVLVVVVVVVVVVGVSEGSFSNCTRAVRS